MKYQIVPVTPFAQNCSLVWCENTLKAAFIDPGGEIEKLMRVAREKKLSIEKIILTHGHIDHVGGALALSKSLGVPIVGPHRGDDYWLALLPEEAEMFHFPKCEAFVPSQWLDDGDKIQFGDVELRVLHCPGHTPGHVVLYHEGSRMAFVGDVLFKGSIGRTDFPGGHYESLIHSIKDKLFSLGDNVTFVPGHGPNSTFGFERRTNPFLNETPRYPRS